MAKKKHRKLFPLLATEPNKTLDCSLGVCDPICPYNCYREPDYYAISPRLSPWSSPHPITVSSPSPSIFAVYQPSQNASPSSFDAITIIAVTGAVLAVLLTGFFFVAKFVSNSVNRENQRQYESNRDDDNDTEEEEYQDREQVDHPIWLIRTTGLQQSIINSITICNYKRGDGLIERTDCPVCLNEFEEEECLRLLPKCNHAFHISCIDTWLKSHTNCPLCRAGIAISAATPRISASVDVTPGGSGSNLGYDGVGEDVDRGEIVNRESDEPGLKEGLSSSYRDSDVKIEISGDGSETERKERVEVLGECKESNGGDSSMDSLSRAKKQIENVDFTGETIKDQDQGLCTHIGDEASCSEDRGSSQSDKAAESSSVSCFNKNKSSVFPL